MDGLPRAGDSAVEAHNLESRRLAQRRLVGWCDGGLAAGLDWGPEIVVKTSENAMTCASMPTEVVVAVGMDPLSWWVLVALFVVLFLSLFCCLGCRSLIHLLRCRRSPLCSSLRSPSPTTNTAL